VYSWDSKKSKSNEAKHGISFEQARDFIFEGVNCLAAGVARDAQEVRHAVIGQFKGKYFVGIFTMTPLGIRIISVRRARHEEESQAKLKGV
jgi:uncharacterized DUF497 family protein